MPPNCRFRVKQTMPIDVPAHSTLSIPFTLEVTKPGSFQASVPIFLEDGGIKELYLSVQGEAKSVKE